MAFSALPWECCIYGLRFRNLNAAPPSEVVIDVSAFPGGVTDCVGFEHTGGQPASLSGVSIPRLDLIATRELIVRSCVDRRNESITRHFVVSTYRRRAHRHATFAHRR